MRTRSRAIAPLRILLLRALITYPMLRALLFVLAALVNAFAGHEASSGLDSPLGVVLLAMLIAAIDIRRRGEALLWANLGYPRATAPGVFGAVALAGELLIAWLRA